MAMPIFAVENVSFARTDAAFGTLCTAAKRIINVYQSYERCRMPREAEEELKNLQRIINSIADLGPVVGAGPKNE